MVYTGSKAVEYVAHPEGIAHKSGSTFSYQYNQTDHLGNVRSVADASKAVVQATDYFPFGLAHTTTSLAKNKYLYNGKELQNDVVGGTPFGQLDYGARMYDATLGVWHSIDPMAEKYYGMSPYVYCGNNPLRFIDPNGMERDDPQEGDHDKEQNLYFSERYGWVSQLFYTFLRQEGYKYTDKNEATEAFKSSFIEEESEPEPESDSENKKEESPTDVYSEIGLKLSDGLGNVMSAVPIIGSVYSYSTGTVGSGNLVLGVASDFIPGKGIYKIGKLASKFIDLMEPHRRNKRKSNSDKHTGPRPGKRYNENQNNKKGEKNKKYIVPANPNKKIKR